MATAAAALEPLEIPPQATADPAEAAQPTDVRTPPPAEEADEPEGEVVEAPPPGNSMREQIAARFRARREEHDGKFAPAVDAADPLQTPPFLSQPTIGEDDAVESDVRPDHLESTAAPVAQRPSAKSGTYRITVRGNAFDVTRDDLVRMSGVDPDEAAELPLSTLLKAAQIMEGSRSYLTEARQTFDESRSGRQPNQQQPAARATATPQEPAEPPPEPIREAIRKITYGDPEEAAADFTRAVDEQVSRRIAADHQQTRVNNLADEADRAITQFGVENPDIIQHLYASKFFLPAAVEEIVEDFKRLGAPDTPILRGLVTNQTDAYKLYNEARCQGLAVRPPSDILKAAGQRTRTAFNLPQSEANQPAPQGGQRQAVQATQAGQRLAAKRALPTQPERSSVGVVQPPDPAQNQVAKRSSVIAQMRASRGQGT
jgi:hypothetical protein